MLQVTIVFVADRFHEFHVGQQTHVLHKGPWLCVRLRVVDRDFYIDVAEIFPAEPLDDVQRFGYWLALLDLTPKDAESFVQYDNEIGTRLNDLPLSRSCVHARHALGQAQCR